MQRNPARDKSKVPALEGDGAVLRVPDRLQGRPYLRARSESKECQLIELCEVPQILVVHGGNMSRYSFRVQVSCESRQRAYRGGAYRAEGLRGPSTRV